MLKRLLSQLFSSSPAVARTATFKTDYGGQGCWWDHSDVLPLAAGRGFNIDVVGESQWQDNIASIVGGKFEHGHSSQVPAQLVFEDNPVDRNAVGVMIDTKPVGWLPADSAAAVRAAILQINPSRKAVTCKAKIVGGWYRSKNDQGNFGVKLSLAEPLRAHVESRSL